MKLRVNKRVNGEYFIQKKFLGFWFDCTDEGEVDILFAEGVCEDFYDEASAIEAMNKLIEEDVFDKKFSKEYTEGFKLDKEYSCKYYGRKYDDR